VDKSADQQEQQQLNPISEYVYIDTVSFTCCQLSRLLTFIAELEEEGKDAVAEAVMILCCCGSCN
jgi:hypothetical protein